MRQNKNLEHFSEPASLENAPASQPPARRAALGSLLAAAALLPGACAKTVEAPADKGVCWHMVQEKAKPVRFYRLSSNQPDLEHCAASLEAMRLKFLSLGGSAAEVDGAYQGQFLFVDPRGVFTSQALDAAPFPMLVRTGDGRLVPPGASTE